MLKSESIRLVRNSLLSCSIRVWIGTLGPKGLWCSVHWSQNLKKRRAVTLTLIQVSLASCLFFYSYTKWVNTSACSHKRTNLTPTHLTLLSFFHSRKNPTEVDLYFGYEFSINKSCWSNAPFIGFIFIKTVQKANSDVEKADWFIISRLIDSSCAGLVSLRPN